jgi:O-antigen ligase
MEAIGVTDQKNTLGTMIMACGLILLWDWLRRLDADDRLRNKVERFAPPFIFCIGVYLLILCDSKTSILSLAIGSLIVISIRFSFLRKKVSDFGLYALLATGIFFVIDRSLGISEALIKSLGRDMTLTGRTEVWKELLNAGTDPLLGTGFMSFWDDESLLSKLPYWVSGSAHNGYIEIYLAGGYIGIGALILMLLGVIGRINRALADGSDYSAVRFAILVMALLANFAESNFACMSPLGMLFLISAIGHGRPEAAGPSGYSAAYYTPTMEEPPPNPRPEAATSTL